MCKVANRQAFLMVTNNISRKIIKRYLKLKQATEHLGDVVLLFHDRVSSNLNVPDGLKIEAFTDEILTELSYTPIRKTLVPGSNHFPVLKFFLKNGYYK